MGRDFLAVVEALYQAAVEPPLWERALSGAVRLLDADHAHFYSLGQSSRTAPMLVTAGLSKADEARFFSPYANEMWGRFLSVIPYGRGLVQAEIVADDEFERCEFYNEIVRPSHGFHSTCYQEAHPEASFHIAICRPRAAGAFARDDARVLERLAPHLTTAMTLRHRLRLSEQHSAGLAAVIERLDEAAIVLDTRRRPLVVNARAMRILDQSDGLWLAGDELRAATPVLTERLRNAIAATGAERTYRPQRLYLPRQTSRLPLLLTVAPIWRIDLAETGMRAPRVVLFIREPDAPLAFNRPALIDSFVLTPRECDVACLLAEGRNVEDIARALGLRPGTVRQNLKSAFDKTCVHSQAALVALVRGFGDQTH